MTDHSSVTIVCLHYSDLLYLDINCNSVASTDSNMPALHTLIIWLHVFLTVWWFIII